MKYLFILLFHQMAKISFQLTEVLKTYNINIMMFIISRNNVIN